MIYQHGKISKLGLRCGRDILNSINKQVNTEQITLTIFTGTCISQCLIKLRATARRVREPDLHNTQQTQNRTPHRLTMLQYCQSAGRAEQSGMTQTAAASCAVIGQLTSADPLPTYCGPMRNECTGITSDSRKRNFYNNAENR